MIYSTNFSKGKATPILLVTVLFAFAIELIAQNDNQSKEPVSTNPGQVQLRNNSPESGTGPLFNTENLTAGFGSKPKDIVSTDNLTGALSYSYDIVIPPGRNGFQPDLKIKYNSQHSNSTPNIFGYGWNVDIPQICRINKSGTNKLYASNYFFSSLSGELSLVSGTTYAPKVENGEFLTYTYSGGYWIVKDKKGITYKFGNTAASRQDNPNNSSEVYLWMLSEARDMNNNYIKYEYYKNAGQIYIDKITYTGNGSLDGVFKAEFLRESRNDILTSYATAFPVVTNYRISEIKVSINGIWVRKYELEYTTGDNGLRSLLSSITESGQDEISNFITRPPISFLYYESTPGWTLDVSTWTSPTYFNSGFQSMIDINGDGLPDIIESHTAIPDQKHVYLNNNDGTWSNNSNLQPPILFRQNEIRGGAHSDSWDQGVRVGDVNGDLLPDIIKAEDNSNNKGGFDAYLNANGASWMQDSIWHPTVTFNGDDNISSWSAHLVDLNGDGLLDIIRKKSVYFGSQINEGSTFEDESSSAWNLPSPLFDLAGPRVRIVDLNGDNLPDVIYMQWNPSTNENDQYTFFNTGNGNWIQDNSGVWDLPVEVVNESSINDSGARFFDVNGDGLPDLVPDYELMYKGRETYLNTGSGWICAADWNVPEEIDISFDGYPTGPISIVDINTDGSLDFFTTQNSNPPVTKAFVNNTKTPTDVLKQISFPEGGYVTIIYKNSPLYKDGSNHPLNPKLPIPFTTVSQIVTNDGNGNNSTESFSYEGGEYYFNAWDDRKPAGFSKITKTDALGNKMVKYYHQGNTTNSSQGEYDDQASKIGKVYRTEILDSLGNVYHVTINKWDRYNLGSGRDFVKLTRATSLTFDGDTGHKDLSKTYTYDNTNGNLIQEVTWGEVAGSSDGSFVDVGTDKFITDISYATNTGAYILSLQKQETTTDQSGAKIRENKYYYDGLASGSINKGNLTKEEKWVTSSSYISIEKTYDSTYGLITSEKDPRGKITTYNYDSYNLYPATITNPLSHVTSYLYDYSLGEPKQVTDQNSFIYQTVYDGLDRAKEEKVPSLSSPYLPVTKTVYAYTDTPGAVAIQKTEYLDASNSVNTFQYFDGRNRLTQERVEAEIPGNYSARDIVYNAVGQVLKESLPYTSTGSARTPATSTNALYINYSYDAIKRVTNVVNALGTTINTYNDWKTTVTDPNGKVKYYYKDAYSNLLRVDEINGGNTFTTNYNWNGNNNLIKITDALGNVRNFTYDGLGRRLTAEDLHAFTDNIFGTWVYAFDSASNLIQTIDPKNQTINYTYNDINQPLTENYAGASGTEVTYIYGGCPNGTDKLCNVVMTSGANTNYTYNSNGAVASEVKTINGIGYTTTYNFDRQGNKTEIINPDNSGIRYTYNTAGLLEKIETKETGGSYTDLINNFDYGPHRKVVKQQNTNATETIKTYDADKMYRLKRILTNSLAGVGGQSMHQPNKFIETKQTLNLDGHKNKEKLTTSASSVIMSFQSNASGDGEIFTSSTSWNTAREAPSGYAAPTTTSGYASVQWWSWNVPKEIRRMVLPFNTAELPDDAVITSAVLKVYVEISYDVENDGNDFIRVVQNTTASPTSLVNDDYDQVGALNNPMAGSNDVDLSTIPTSAYLNINLNSAGLSWINKTGWTKLGLREGHDIMNDPLNIPGGSGIRIYTSNYGSNFPPYLEITYVIINQSPSESTGLETEGEANPQEVFDTTPVFTAIYNDPNPIDQAASFQIQVSTSTNFLNLLWDSGKQSFSTPIEQGTECSPISYGGIPLAQDGSTYYWRIKFWDDDDAEGAWSTETASFTMYNSAILVIQDLNFTYDPNGNITKIVDASETDTYKTVDYTYDDLNRLLTATATNVAPGQSTYTQTYTYNVIGNITSGPLGTYTYSGNGYYNPHAVTTIGSTSYTYDQNGNQITDGIKNRTFDYKNRLVSHDIPGAPSTVIFYSQTGDGNVYHNTSTSWATAHNASTGTSANYTSNTLNVGSGKYNSTKYQIDRAFLPFNTASLPDSSNITSAKLKVYVSSKLDNDNDGDDWITVTQSTQGSPTNLVTGDYSKAGSATNPLEGISPSERKDITSISTGSYLELNLNQTGLSFISKTSSTKLALREGHDALNSPYVGSSGTYDRLTLRTSEYSGTSNDPILEVTYTPTLSETYAYDHTGSRVQKINPSQTTIVPSKYYSKEGSTDVKYVFLPAQAGEEGMLLATIRGTGTNASLFFMHTDHLGSSEKTTDNLGNLVETSDYFPYGQPRISQSTINDRKGYIGKDYDSGTELSFLEARYYNGKGGRFTSQDLAFQDIGSKEFEDKYKRTLQMHLMNPQSLNSYSYANNNPTNLSDPNGQILPLIPVIGAILSAYGFIDLGIDAYDLNTVAYKYPEQFSQQEKNQAYKALGVDLFTIGVGSALKGTESILFDGLTTVVEMISDRAAEARKQNEINTERTGSKNNTKTNTKPSDSSPSSQAKNNNYYHLNTDNAKACIVPSTNKQIFDSMKSIQEKVIGTYKGGKQ